MKHDEANSLKSPNVLFVKNKDIIVRTIVTVKEKTYKSNIIENGESY
jgi:hypothetical protein